MKFHTPQPQPKLKKRASVANPTSDSKIDFFKWIGLTISLIGIGAWMAGDSYSHGYWGAAGNTGPIVQPTLQQTAWMGFLGPYQYWLWAAGMVAIMGMYVVFLAVESKKKKNPGRVKLAVEGFLQDRLKIDAGTAALGVLIFTFAVVAAYLVFVLGFWVALSHDAGKDDFEMAVCHARAAKSFSTTIVLIDGKKIVGKFLDQTEKSAILLDQTSIYRIAFGDKSQIVSSTSTNEIKCQAN